MLVGANIFAGRTHHDPLIYRDLARQANGYGCSAGGKPSPAYRPDLYPALVDATTCQPQSILSSKSPLPAGPYEVRADGKGEVWFQFDGVPGGWKKLKLDGSGNPQALAFDGPLPPGKSLIARVMSSEAADPFRNLRITLPGGGPGTFRPEFLGDLAGFRVHRHLDTRSVNDDPTVTWDAMRAEQPPGASNDASTKVPFEDLCELANVSGADPWFCIPFHADAAYIESMARLIDEKLDRSRTVYVEYSNEMWNTGFEQAKAAETYWKATDPTGSKQATIGRLSGAAANRFRAALSPSRKCVRVASGQAGYLSNSRLAVIAAMESGGVDAIACAPYFGIFGSADVPALTALGKRWGAGDATALDELFAMLPPTIDAALGWTRGWRGLADQMGVPLLLYECGQHLSNRNDAAVADLYTAANRDARMGDLYTAYLDGLRDAGASLACLYASHYSPSKYGNWGLREWVGQPDAPKAAAVRAWMVKNPVVEPEPDPAPEPPTLTLLASLDLMIDADGNVSFRARRPG